MWKSKKGCWLWGYGSSCVEKAGSFSQQEQQQAENLHQSEKYRCVRKSQWILHLPLSNDKFQSLT